ncbi:MAG: hypothetical protein M0Z65_10120 [Firmicutes bacterium]|uniref:Uncharacterized protein n=1 Tax=Melghirimyces thermohalophilus TaxID=1236220 RepID=A0A1G6IAI5_9BACL|nr:hypothetical protein [Melghirimyces thermohalophilus]MDA8353519.1 hypothetical protein [Bacillota bacterium]SDC03537.1 hypothetical protein SAMN04488112_102141 [Melghirimyces thermohalophilus]
MNRKDMRAQENQENSRMNRKARIGAALFLFILSPFIGELLLGNLASEQLIVFPLLALLYGGGALFIREWVRRTGRGWPTIFCLALAYGLLEEGFVIQTLFNPNYLGLGLLDYGFIPSLGIGSFWSVYVLSLHVIWSISIPIAVTESLFWKHRTTPWLGRFGFTMCAILFFLGSVIMGLGVFYEYQFMASVKQLMISATLMMIFIVLGFTLFHKDKKVNTYNHPKFINQSAPNPWLLGGFAFISGSIFFLLSNIPYVHALLPAGVLVPILLLLELLVLVVTIRSSHKKGWSDIHRFSLAAGGMLVYCWGGFLTNIQLYGYSHLFVQGVWCFLAIALIVFIGSRLHRQSM